MFFLLLLDSIFLRHFVGFIVLIDLKELAKSAVPLSRMLFGAYSFSSIDLTV